MRNIKISEEVWQAIAERGKFGETEDDVLRRVFNLPSNSNFERKNFLGVSPRVIRAKRRMSSFVDENKLYVSFQGGPSNSWELPDPSDKSEIRKVRDSAVSFAKANGATIGQINAVKKALTEAGYYLTK